MKTTFKKYINSLLCSIVFLAIALEGYCQPATVTVPLAVGTSGCNSGTQQLHYYNYNGGANTIANSANPLPCVPVLKVGGTNFTFNTGAASISYNPKDTSIYYFYTQYSNTAYCPACGTTPRTFSWKWKAGTCPTSTTPRLDTTKSFTADLLGVAFDAAGNGWAIENFGVAPFKVLIRPVNFTTGVIGIADTMVFTGGAKIYNFSSGDIAISPSGQMYFVVNNKLFTPDYTNYTTAAPRKITCTYIDTVKAPAGPGMNLVGLTYADGKLLSSYNGSAPFCGMRKIDLLTGDTSIIAQTGTQSASDFASIISGVGASKKLVSVSNISGNTYDVEYYIYVKNYGNYPLTNVQIKDSVPDINGLANVSNVAAYLVSNPAGVTLNPSYNGTTVTNILAAGQNLPAYPASNNNFTIRVVCRLNNINKGVIYNNRAFATANGFVNVALRDSSTDGNTPDLNANDKPDDKGESQPTPLLISVVAQTPPCATLTNILFTQNFNAFNGLSNSVPVPTMGSGATFVSHNTGYTAVNTQPIPIETFTLTNNANKANTADFINLTDHTGNPNGAMMVINADANNAIMYQVTLNANLCSNQQYSLSYYAAFIGNANYSTVCAAFGGFKYPQIKMRIRDASTGLIITEASTTAISGTSWSQYGLKFTSPASYTSIIVDLINDAPGGCGNDIAIDDVQFGACDPLPTVSINNVSAGCLGSSTSFKVILNDPGVITGTPDYQWQVSTDNATWSNISGAPNSDTYTIPSVTASDVNKYYRARVAGAGNLGNPSCTYPSPSFYLTGTGCDIDKDNDGITDIAESFGNDPFNDDNFNGTQNFQDPAFPGFVDTNSDGINDNFDNDKDGIINALDRDSDNDGIPDVIESWGVDGNGDGIIGNYVDTDNDGLSQNVDANNTGAAGSGVGLGIPDLDGDGVANFVDLDSDNDGIPDVVEVYGADVNNDGKLDGYVDTDGDGYSDPVDGDVGNDGVAENSAGVLLENGPDMNGDGRADSWPNKNMDGDGRPQPYDLDSDNDGITDVREAGFTDADNNGFCDGVKGADGWDDSIDALATLTLRSSDFDGRVNYLDIDSDNDGIPDQIEGIATASYNFPTYLDTDNDGLDNRYDLNPAFGGNGYTPNNQDADALPDYIDSDSDNDGKSDLFEGNDFNFNGKNDDGVVLSGADVDRDGLDDFFDNDNASLKSTSLYLGTGGSPSGDVAYGSKTTVQRNAFYGCATERDWRCASFILDVDFLSISANLNIQSANISWVVTCDKVIDHFDIERSINGTTFIKVAEVKGIGTTCKATPFYATDNIANVSSAQIYYRVKAISLEGKTKIGQVVSIQQKYMKYMALSPNPTTTNPQLTLTTARITTAQVNVFNSLGKQVLHQNYQLQVGTNMFAIQNIAQLSNGTYTVQVILNGETNNIKLIKQ